MQQSSTVVNAAALQDHLARAIALDVRVRPRPARARSSIPAGGGSALLSSEAPRGERGGDNNDSYRLVWVCDACTFENNETARSSRASTRRDRCGMCGAARLAAQERAPLSLAQKLGLVPRPPPKLSAAEWERCEQQAENRGDASHPCSICREPFGVKQQVILSCSHMFHLDCIASFERFLRAKQRVCPLCRKQDYQKRATTRAAAQLRERSAARIQALVRGSLIRRRLVSHWHQFYASGKGDPTRRRRFLANRVGESAHRLATAMQQRSDSVDALLAEFDRSIRLSRRIFEGPEIDNDEHSKAVPGDDWDTIYRKASAREDHECAICLNAFEANKRGAALLSCSHVFHARCLAAFEDFGLFELPLCPVCRAAYRSRPYPAP